VKPKLFINLQKGRWKGPSSSRRRSFEQRNVCI